MGYTHYWRQKRAFTDAEWQQVTAEAKRICAKAMRGMYSGKEDFASMTKSEVDEHGFRTGFAEETAWRTFPHDDCPTPMQGAAIPLANSHGEPGTMPEIDADCIALNGVQPKGDYESFVLEREPTMPDYYNEQRKIKELREGLFSFCKTEYRPYDAVVVSILAAAAKIAPDAFFPSSDGGAEAIKLMF